jgi:hypothetical protein
MAIHYNPKIVDDGLVLYLDAANLRSYPGSGTAWLDLSGNQNSGQFVGNPTLTPNGGNGFFFNGSSDGINIAFNASTMDFSLAQTICMWMKPSTGSESARRNPYNQAYGGPGTLTHEPNRTINYYFGTNGGNSTPYVGINSVFTVQTNELVFITVTRSQQNNICQWYKNGKLISTSNAGGYAATANGTSPILIAQGYVSRFVGDIYKCYVYNRFLTAQEVQQNFNATRGRFGL